MITEHLTMCYYTGWFSRGIGPESCVFLVFVQLVPRWQQVLGSRIHECGQLDIASTQAVHIVRGERYLHLVVDIEPLRMVIHLLGQKCHPRHEAERLHNRQNVLYSNITASI